jgi:flagellin-like protein
MRGISEIITLVLILLIVIALAGLTYSWFPGIIATLTGTAQDSAGNAKSSMTTDFKIESAKNVTPSVVTVTIRNIGSAAINVSKMGVYINDERVSNDGPTYMVSQGGTSTFNVSGAMDPRGKQMKLVSETGVWVSTTIT